MPFLKMAYLKIKQNVIYKMFSYIFTLYESSTDSLSPSLSLLCQENEI